MLKTTYGALQGSFEPLSRIGQQDALTPEMKLRVAKVMKAYDLAHQQLVKQQKELQEKAAGMFAKPTLAVPLGTKVQSEEERQQLRNEWLTEQADKLFVEPIEVDCKPLFASRFGTALPPAGHLLMLDWLIVDDITEEDTVQ